MSAGTAAQIALNRRMWDERVPIHAVSDFYDVAGFRAGAEVLDRFQLDELGDVDGKDLVHLQCHIGVDTLAWARRGARVTGLDFSVPATEVARSLAADLGLAERAAFVAADLYDAPAALGGRRFDVVYTGAGALCWLPDLPRWGDVVASLLRPGGVLYLAEFHPVTDILDDERGGEVTGDYFDTRARTYEAPGSYVDWNAPTVHNTSVEWHHTLGEVVTALAAAGLRLEFLHERDATMFQRYGSLVRDNGRYRFPDGAPRPPLMYSLAARA
ncbi:SAM-dependent methyltransferase [Spinactinospora alkalitolerans]|uniref:SAM-dependent methyltransferase n=1 Tax=Spinactinospora alkalitolerans TaxID=687207 RepID=A0A852TVW6_9ACTN|nr:methyltransferase domain-containing protein [Spinactinospora alkalitolerans]NYE47447.1 SAM-dependent methyltransferase [Spinactinospora alkalitolerans]